MEGSLKTATEKGKVSRLKVKGRLLKTQFECLRMIKTANKPNKMSVKHSTSAFETDRQEDEKATSTHCDHMDISGTHLLSISGICKDALPSQNSTDIKRQ